MKYRISVGYQILMYVFAAALIVFSGFMVALVFSPSGKSPGVIGFCGLLFAAGGIALIVNTIKTQVNMEEDQITVSNLQGRRTLLFSEIRGYREGEKESFFLIPFSGDDKLSIPQNLQNRATLLLTLREKYPDLNKQESKEELSRMLADERFGASAEDRQALLDSARKPSLILNFTPLLFLLVIMISPGYFEAAFWAALLWPWILAGVTWRYKGLIAIIGRKNKPYPSLISGLVLSVFAVLIGFFRQYDIYQLDSHAWILFLVSGSVWFGAYYYLCKASFDREEKKQTAMIGFALLFFIYGAVLTCFTNCRFDGTTPQSFSAQVERKHVSRGRYTSYHVALSPWGRYDDGEDFNIARSLYIRLAQGDSLHVRLYPGKWNIPWYHFSRGGTLITPGPGAGQ